MPPPTSPPRPPMSVRFSPSRQRVRPGQEIRLECSALSGEVRQNPTIDFFNGTPVALDSLFRVEHPRQGRVVAIIPRGTYVPWRHMEFQ